jgi:hypothetical protein
MRNALVTSAAKPSSRCPDSGRPCSPQSPTIAPALRHRTWRHLPGPSTETPAPAPRAGPLESEKGHASVGHPPLLLEAEVCTTTTWCPRRLPPPCGGCARVGGRRSVHGHATHALPPPSGGSPTRSDADTSLARGHSSSRRRFVRPQRRASSVCLLQADHVASCQWRPLEHEHRSARMPEEAHVDSRCSALRWPGDGPPARVRATRLVALEGKAAESFVPEVGIAGAVMGRRAVDCT